MNNMEINARSPYLSWRAWTAMILGTILTGIGIGLMLIAGLGVSPLDAFFAGLAGKTGFTVGVVLMAISVVFVVIAWVLGAKSGIGTIVSFLGIGIFVDITMALFSGLHVSDWGLLFRSLWWLGGFGIFAVGVLGLFSSGLGASPYDQIVKAISVKFHISLGRSRLFFDAAAVIVALFLGGALGVGTVIMLLFIPLVLNKGVPIVHKVIHPPAAASETDS